MLTAWEGWNVPWLHMSNQGTYNPPRLWTLLPWRAVMFFEGTSQPSQEIFWSFDRRYEISWRQVSFLGTIVTFFFLLETGCPIENEYQATLRTKATEHFGKSDLLSPSPSPSLPSFAPTCAPSSQLTGLCSWVAVDDSLAILVEIHDEITCVLNGVIIRINLENEVATTVVLVMCGDVRHCIWLPNGMYLITQRKVKCCIWTQKSLSASWIRTVTNLTLTLHCTLSLIAEINMHHIVSYWTNQYAPLLQKSICMTLTWTKPWNRDICQP